MTESSPARLEDLPLAECLDLLREGSVGRLTVIRDEYPMILPINYRLVETSGRRWIAIRTRAGNVIDVAPMHAAFEIDAFDHAHREGWTVLARGILQHVDPDAAGFRERFDPDSWLGPDRDSWMILEPFAITGRRLHGAEPAWAFEPRAYL